MIILSSGSGNYIWSNGKKYSYFGGNNYLGLTCHPSVCDATIESVKKYGVNFSASRITTGTADIHLELESALSDFKGKQDAVVFASGYQGNGILLEILKSSYSVIFMDEFAHPSIYSCMPREIQQIRLYRHCDASHLASLIEGYNDGCPLVITDGVFALTGEIAPLDMIYQPIQKKNGILIVDDAHATGILGDTGKGTPEHFNLHGYENIFQTETMSKALGSYGGFIAGHKNLTDLIRKNSATYQSSTALPPPIAAASLAALKIIKNNPGLRSEVLRKAGYLRKAIISMGFDTTNGITPVIPIKMPSEVKAKSLSSYMEQKGIIAPFMNYPYRQKMHIIRVTVSANHTEDQMDEFLRSLKEWRHHEAM